MGAIVERLYRVERKITHPSLLSVDPFCLDAALYLA
jgi:hypothetical protein